MHAIESSGPGVDAAPSPSGSGAPSPPRRPYGRSGLEVSAVGLGAGALGDGSLSEREAERALLAALSMGVTLVDTAPSYGASEERIGRFLGAHRDAVVLSTKGGYGVAGVPDWTPDAITLGIEGALGRLRTDRLDIFHLHSCPLETLRDGALLERLERAKVEGKIRVAAYSGENDALAYAAEQPVFGGLQCSVNPFDQRSARTIVPEAAARGLGVLAKRALGNAPWRFAEVPVGNYAETYHRRMRLMEAAGFAPPEGLSWSEVAARFSVFAPGVSAILVGTTKAAHLAEVIAHVARGPLPEATRRELGRAFDAHGAAWAGEI